MAKISARGATKLFDVEVVLKGTDTTYRFTLTSDGRVLRQVRDWDGKLTPFTVWGQIAKPENRNREWLLAQLARRNYEVQQ